MSAIEAVAEAIQRAFDHTPSDDVFGDCARAAINALAAQEDITDEQIVDALTTYRPSLKEWSGARLLVETARALVPFVRALLDQQRAVDAARIAELEARAGAAKVERDCNRADYIIALDRAHKAEAEVTALRATVADLERREGEWNSVLEAERAAADAQTADLQARLANPTTPPTWVKVGPSRPTTPRAALDGDA